MDRFSEPDCNEVGCEPSMGIPISVREAPCVHCGQTLYRTHAGRWLPYDIDDNLEVT
jgi:hypothetical protein